MTNPIDEFSVLGRGIADGIAGGVAGDTAPIEEVPLATPEAPWDESGAQVEQSIQAAKIQAQLQQTLDESNPISMVEKAFDKYLEWNKDKDACLVANVGKILDEVPACATAAAVAIGEKVPKTVGVMTVIKECVDVVKPFIECHVDPEQGS